MKIKLNNMFASNVSVDEFDVKQIKKALNRLGYYQPFKKVGITGMPDAAIFDALRKFQKDQGIQATGIVRPDDETVKALNIAASSKKNGEYIWRSVGDDNVRDSHAEFNGTIRNLSESPDPGEEFNCRCWVEFATEPAEKPQKQEANGLRQEVISKIKDASDKWGDFEFVKHFYIGGGKEKTLSEIGLLRASVEHAKDIMFDEVLEQIKGRARFVKNGFFTGSWNNSYPFGSVVFSFGGVTIKGRFGGSVKKDGEILIIEAKAEYEFSDMFTDPLNKRQKKIGSSAIEDIPYDFSKPWWNKGNIGAAYFAADTEYLGTPYEINGKWKTKIEGSIPETNK